MMNNLSPIALVLSMRASRDGSAASANVPTYAKSAFGDDPGRLRYLVRRMGVWGSLLLLTALSVGVTFVITGVALELTGLGHPVEAYLIALACSGTIAPGTIVALLLLIRRLDEAELQLYRLARTDELTGLPNRRALMEATAEPVDRAEPISMLFIDIDHFKRVNDTYGHKTGDAILRQVTQALTQQLRDGDLLCRYGGEEFAALLRNTDTQAAQQLAERVRDHVAATAINIGASSGIRISISIGVAGATDARHINIYQLIDHADRALYQAKHDGRNCVRSA